MKKILILLIILLPIKSYSADEEQINKITKNLRCLICQGQSIYDSQSEFANSLKKVIEDKINENMTEQQVYEFLTQKYGRQKSPKFINIVGWFNIAHINSTVSPFSRLIVL